MPHPYQARRFVGLGVVALLLAVVSVNAAALAQQSATDTSAVSPAANSSSVDGWAGQLVATAKQDGRIVFCLDVDGWATEAIRANCPGTLHHLCMYFVLATPPPQRLSCPYIVVFLIFLPGLGMVYILIRSAICLLRQRRAGPHLYQVDERLLRQRTPVWLRLAPVDAV
jgi:hypothetical protein